MFAGNKSDNFNLDLNGPAIGENDNGKEHPVNKLKQKLNDEKKLISLRRNIAYYKLITLYCIATQAKLARKDS